MGFTLPPPTYTPSTSDRIAGGLLQFLQLREAKNAARQEHEKQLELMDLQRKKFDLEAKTTQHAMKVAEMAANRAGLNAEEDNAIKSFNFMQGAPGPVGDISQGVSGIQGLPKFALDQALARATQNGEGPQVAPREDMSQAQPIGQHAPVQFPLAGGGTLSRRPLTDIQLQQEQAKVQELATRGVFQSELAKRQAAALAPPTQDQVADNNRLEQAAADARAQRIQANQIALMAAQSSADIKSLTYQLQKDRLDLDREKLAQAKEEAARTNSPEAIRTITEGVLNRNVDYNQLDRYQRANVDRALGEAGLAIPRTLTGTEKTNQTKAESAYQSTEIVADILNRNPEALAIAATPFLGRLSPEAQALKLHLAEMSDVKSRLRTGAAISNYEEKFYGNQVPNLGDLVNPEAIKVKLNHFRGLNLSETGRPVLLTAPDGKETFVITDGFNAGQRAELRKRINMGWVPSPYTLTLPKTAASPAADPLGILK